MTPLPDLRKITEETIKALEKHRHPEDMRTILDLYYIARRKAEGARVVRGPGPVPKV